MRNFANYGKMRRAALMVVAHRSSSAEVSDLRQAFLALDTERNGVITLPELAAVLGDSMDKDAVSQIFAQLGTVAEAKVIYSGQGDTRVSRGFGFVTFLSE